MKESLLPTIPLSPAPVSRACSRAAWAWVFALVLAALPLSGFAQDDDLPGRVGRVADFAGQLLLSQQDRADEWEPIGANYPVTSGVNLWVSSDGRAEIDYGGGQFRLAGDTNVHVARLDDRELALFVAQGRVIIRVRVQDPGEATRVDTPNTQVTLMRPGLYRVDVAADGQTTSLVVREGEASVALANESRQVLPGQAVSVAGADPVIADIRNAQGADGFDTWSANRDRRYEGLRSSTYVSRQMVGAADLDRYGSWQPTQEYGPVWFPYGVAPDWAPYRDGYWADIGGWGPTWVDSAPWGYAPFHYGRWAFIGGRWGWCPGGYVARPVWAPALVAWHGGPGWGVGYTNGRPLYGWVPLGWHEPYYPGWRRCSVNCWARFNRPHGIDVSQRASGPPMRHVNLAVPGALSAVPATSLAGHASVRSNLVNVPAQLASSAPPMRTIPSVGYERRQAPSVAPGVATLPPAASTYARVPRRDATSSGASPRQIVPARASASTPAGGNPVPAATTVQREPGRGLSPPPQRPLDAAAPAQAPRRAPTAESPPQRQQTRVAQPQPPSPSLQPPATVAAPPRTVTAPPAPMRVAPQGPIAPAAPALVAPQPNAQGQASPAAASSARGGRSGSAPEGPAAGTTVPR